MNDLSKTVNEVGVSTVMQLEYNRGVDDAMKELRKLAIWGGHGGSHRYTRAMDALRALKK